MLSLCPSAEFAQANHLQLQWRLPCLWWTPHPAFTTHG